MTAREDPESADSQRQGTLVAHFRVGEALGQGGMANVLEAVDTRSGEVVALKVLHAHTAAHSEALARFTREARALQNVQHPNIVRVIEHGVTDDGDAWIAMERLHGMSLAEIARRQRRLEPARAVRLVRDVAKALATVHARGLVHRDIKPENIFVVMPGTPSEHAKLIDFGVARVTERELGEGSVQYTRFGALLGSVAFMAPEQSSPDEVDARTDVFALGASLYEALTGELPFEGKTVQAQMESRRRGAVVPLRERVRDVTFPAELEALVTRMLSADKARRPDGGLGALRELSAVLMAIEPSSAYPTSLVPSAMASPAARRPSTMPLLMTFVALAVFGLAAVAFALFARR